MYFQYTFVRDPQIDFVCSSMISQTRSTRVSAMIHPLLSLFKLGTWKPESCFASSRKGLFLGSLLCGMFKFHSQVTTTKMVVLIGGSDGRHYLETTGFMILEFTLIDFFSSVQSYLLFPGVLVLYCMYYTYCTAKLPPCFYILPRR